ncbi:MAG: ATP-binding protein [Burkholderiaceae bacterium]|nr:ATP-binding protein [Burkholderiaceae bacterium]
MARLIFFCGHAGAGKTTLAKLALPLLHERTGESFCLIDKDTLYGEFSSRVMGLLTGNADDRDSPTYLDNLRDQEYSGMIDVARENLELDVNTVLVGPFSREVKSRLVFNPLAMRIPVATAISLVWVVLDEKTAKERIIARGDHRDRYKLEHWDEYRRRRFHPDPEQYPEVVHYDNTDFDQQEFDALVACLADPSQGCRPGKR